MTSKGGLGEKRVASLLKQLPESEYRTINNLLININGHTSQIDHVVVSLYGIFVIETKFYMGRIYGGENSEYWTQNIYGNKNQFRNPILQNMGHIKALRRVLNNSNQFLYISIVAFSQQAILDIYTNTMVVYWNEIIPVIEQFEERKLTYEQVQEIYNILLSINSDSKATRSLHIQNVIRNKIRRNEAVKSGKCPRCGGKLVLRQGKYGAFYGCFNYPRCTYILPL